VRLILIRHGQTASNTGHLLDTGYPGAPLDEVGLAQADALVGTLADEPIEAIMTSDLTRARQTAAPLAAALGIEPTSHPGLREIGAGDLEMSPEWRPYVDVIQSWPHDPTRRIPGGETGLEFFHRYDGAIQELAATGLGCAAAVSHGGAMRAWLRVRAAGLPDIADGQWILGNTATVVLDNADGPWRVVRWADRFLIVQGGDDGAAVSSTTSPPPRLG
jgi:probable phosphoglycerate mutase